MRGWCHMNYLKAIYKRIYTNTFAYSKFEDRKELQKAIYLLENMGVDVGDYSFTWDSYGPYSLSLDCEASQIPDEAEDLQFQFSPFAEECFSRVKKIAEEKTSYDRTTWMECVASMYYLKNIFRYADENLISELKKRKPYLKDDIANGAALEVAKTIKVGA